MAEVNPLQQTVAGGGGHLATTHDTRHALASYVRRILAVYECFTIFYNSSSAAYRSFHRSWPSKSMFVLIHPTRYVLPGVMLSIEEDASSVVTLGHTLYTRQETTHRNMSCRSYRL